MEKFENIVDYIPVGHENAVTREQLSKLTKMSDRKVRKAIEKARETTCICNMSDGAGYYIPTELREVELFIRQESARGKSVFRNLRGAKTMKKLMEKEQKGEVACE